MSDKVRIELRFDKEKDKGMIDFIDQNGDSRAGFIKEILHAHKSRMEEQDGASDEIEKETASKKKDKKKKSKDKSKNKSKKKKKKKSKDKSKNKSKKKKKKKK